VPEYLQAADRTGGGSKRALRSGPLGAWQRLGVPPERAVTARAFRVERRRDDDAYRQRGERAHELHRLVGERGRRSVDEQQAFATDLHRDVGGPAGDQVDIALHGQQFEGRCAGGSCRQRSCHGQQHGTGDVLHGFLLPVRAPAGGDVTGDTVGGLGGISGQAVPVFMQVQKKVQCAGLLAGFSMCRRNSG